MSTVVVARKGSMLVIASDSLVTFGETRLPPGYEANDKMFKLGGSIVGAVGSTAHLPVLRQALSSLPPDERQLDTRDGLFETFVRLHPKLMNASFSTRRSRTATPTRAASFRS